MPLRATRSSFGVVYPLSDERERFPFQASYSPREFELLSRGLIPQEMEDKWLIFWEDGTLFFHRSWTGFCVYEVRLEQVADGYEVAEAWVCRDRTIYNGGTPKDEARLVSFLINNLLLGKSTAFPLPSRFINFGAAALLQHSISGTGYPSLPGGWLALREWWRRVRIRLWGV